MKIGPHPGEKLAHRYCAHADCRADAFEEMMAMAVALKRPDIKSHASECLRADVQVVCRRTARKGPVRAELPERRSGDMSIRHTNCTILRTFERRHGTMSLNTGGVTMTRAETVTEPCGTPLFGHDEQATGVCRSCAKGWTHENNTFASDVERDRACLAKVRA